MKFAWEKMHSLQFSFDSLSNEGANEIAEGAMLCIDYTIKSLYNHTTCKCKFK